MGLLDGLFDSEQGRMGLGLLAAGSARGDGAGFGQRLSEAVGSVDQWKKAKAQAEYQKQQMAMQAMQMQQYQAQAAQQQAAAQEQARINGILPSLVKRPSQGAPAMNVDSLLPPEFRAGTPTVGAVPASAGGFDMQEALRQRVPLKTIEELQKLTAGPEFSPEVRYDQSGKAFMTAKNGEVKYLSGINARDKLVETDLGGTKGFRTEYSSDLVGSLPKTMTFADKNAAGNLALSRERFNFDQRGGAEAGKPKWDAATGSFVYMPDANNPQGRVVPADGFVKPLGETAKKTLSGVESLNGAVGEYLKGMESWGASDAMRPDKRAAMGTLYNNMMLQAKEAYNLGVLNGPDLDILQSVVTDPRSWTGAITSNAALSNQAKELSRIMSKITAPAVRDSGAKAESTQATGGTGMTFQDSAKESRYQEWVRKNKG